LLSGIPETTFNRWLKSQESRYIIASNYQLIKDSLRGGLKLKGVLYAELAERRKRGQRCSSRWLSRRMILLCQDMYSDRETKAELELFRACSNWRRSFYARFNLRKRKRTNKKSLSMEVRTEKWIVYHGLLRQYLKRGIQQDDKMEDFLLKTDTKWNKGLALLDLVTNQPKLRSKVLRLLQFVERVELMRVKEYVLYK
jgi:hypothetical protein